MLKHRIKSLEEVPEALRGFYVKDGDGFVLPVEGMVAKSVVDEFRDNNVNLMKQLEAFKGVDVNRFKELVALEEQMKKGGDKEKIEAAVAERVRKMREEHEAQVTDLTAKLKSSNGQLETLVIDNQIHAAANKIGALPSAVTDILLRGKQVFSLEEGKVVAKGPDGKPIYGKNGTDLMSIGEWAESLKASSPHLFPPVSGSNAPRGRTNANGQVEMTARERIRAGLGDK